VVSIAEITGMQDGVISMQELFEFQQSGLDSNKKVQGEHVGLGLRPYHENKFKEASIELRADLFSQPIESNMTEVLSEV
jgi:pilus assembly protein CpaF